MDISTIVVVLILIALFLGGVIWMEFHAQKTSPKAPIEDRKKSKSKETDLEQYSRFFQWQANRTASIKTSSDERNHE